jgi:tetratricopeptide (TPR) repeat protein
VDALEKLVTEAENLVKEFGTRSADQVRWNTAQSLFEKEEYGQAVLEYGQIEESSDYYEKALVGIGMSRVYEDQWEEADKLFSDYLNSYVTDPAKSVTSSPARAARRKEAMALAEFFRGFMASAQARESNDPELHKRVIELLTPYADRYGDQTKLAPQAMYFLVLSLLSIDDRATARTTLERMVSDYPESSSTGKAAVNFYKALETAKDAATDPERKRILLREMAEHLERANAIASSPSWANLRNESVHWIDLGEWEKAEKVLRKIIAVFSEDAERKGGVTTYALPDLGRVLLEQKRVAEAKETLAPLVTTAGSKPSRATVLDYGRSVTGWLEGKGTEVVVIPGAGGEVAEFEDVAKRIDVIADGMDTQWSCEWY